MNYYQKYEVINLNRHQIFRCTGFQLWKIIQILYNSEIINLNSDAK